MQPAPIGSIECAGGRGLGLFSWGQGAESPPFLRLKFREAPSVLLSRRLGFFRREISIIQPRKGTVRMPEFTPRGTLLIASLLGGPFNAHCEEGAV